MLLAASARAAVPRRPSPAAAAPPRQRGRGGLRRFGLPEDDAKSRVRSAYGSRS